MMIAKASGNAARSPIPPRISHVSFASQIGATVFMMSVRLSSSGASGARMPTPRSKPSSSTYMKTPPARMTVQTGTRSICTISRVRVRARQRPRRAFAELRLAQLNMLRRTRARESRHVEDAGTEHDEVDDDIERDGRQHVGTGQRRRHRVLRAHQSVDDPRLTADFGNGPTGKDGDESCRNHRDANVLVQARREQAILEA